MASNIHFEITPITEATEAISETIRDFFLKEVDGDYIDPQIEVDIDDYLEGLKDELYCVIEYPYVDKVYRDSYYNYYSSKHMPYKRDCIRVSLFSAEVKSEDFLDARKHQTLQANYRGFFVLRPTINALFGRAVISPEAFDECDYKICKCKAESLVYGVKLLTEGFPHSSQDEETIQCAETTVWAIMEYFGTKYADYRPTLPSKIHKALERFSYERQIPSDGLTMSQISFALKEFGFATRIYSKGSYGNEIYSIIDSYVESGIPVIVGLQSGEMGHVIIAIGKQYKEKCDWSQITKSKFLAQGDEVEYYEATKIPTKYIVQDDNMPPYEIVSLESPGEHYEDAESQKYEIDSIVVPLYPKIYLEAVVAKELALQIVKDETLGFKFPAEFVFRSFLASSRSFKSQIASNQEMNATLKYNVLATKMPKFIWCAEFYSKEGYNTKEKEALGLIVLDATEANKESIDALIFAGYPDRSITMNENNLVTLQQSLEKYRYYNNLK